MQLRLTCPHQWGETLFHFSSSGVLPLRPSLDDEHRANRLFESQTLIVKVVNVRVVRWPPLRSISISALVDLCKLQYEYFLNMNGASGPNIPRPGIPLVSCRSCVLHCTRTLTSILRDSALYLFALVTIRIAANYPKRLDLPYSVQMNLVIQRLAPTLMFFPTR